MSAAREYLEAFTRRALLTQTWDLKLDAFPCADEVIWLPKPPVASVTSITYLDTAGASQTWSSSLYRTDLPAGPMAQRARITPAYAQYYPSTYGVTNAVTVRFVCGYGGATDVPAMLRACVLEHVRASYLRGDPDEAMKIRAWVRDQAFQFKAF